MNEINNILNGSPQYVKGVGPKRADLLKKLGVKTIRDLLYLLPRRYEDRSRFKKVKDLNVGSLETVKGEVIAIGERNSARGKKILQVALADSSGIVYATWFNQPYMKRFFKVKDQVIVSGRVQYYQQLQLASPDFEVLSGDDNDRLHVGRVVPVYPLTERLNQRSMRTLMKNVIDQYSVYLNENLPEELLVEFNLVDLHKAINNIHFPERLEYVNVARKRLVFEEFFLLELGLARKKQTIKKEKRLRSYRNLNETFSEFKKSIPFSLTDSQKTAVKDIMDDLGSQHPMNRLLQGDVGSGKTVVAFFALLSAVRCDCQAALMVPSEVLAQQHHKTLSEFFVPHGIEVGLLISDIKKSQKNKLLEKIRNGNVPIVVGTQAIIEKTVEFKDLALVVVDEQHRFGVVQRSELIKKGMAPDVLVMTATPIPRTLALTVYGDLDVSVIDERPPGRGKMSTHWIKEARLEDAYGFVKKEAAKGHGTFIIYPLVDESDKIDLKAAQQMYEKLRTQVFPELRLALLHGRMDAQEKNQVLFDFRSGNTDVLVATTVIEVGIDIPAATVMLIENAERFGLSQLHQLRGRIGRSHRRSYCVLEGEPQTIDGKLRLQAMVDTQDGFKIAEKDLEIRGPGDFFGTKQHGLPDFKVANLVTDAAILRLARKAAFSLIKRDPDLKGEQVRKLIASMPKKFAQKVDLYSVG